jgi:hypothetical protein
MDDKLGWEIHCEVAVLRLPHDRDAWRASLSECCTVGLHNYHKGKGRYLLEDRNGH